MDEELKYFQNFIVARSIKKFVEGNLNSNEHSELRGNYILDNSYNYINDYAKEKAEKEISETLYDSRVRKFAEERGVYVYYGPINFFDDAESKAKKELGRENYKTIEEDLKIQDRKEIIEYVRWDVIGLVKRYNNSGDNFMEETINRVNHELENGVERAEQNNESSNLNTGNLTPPPSYSLPPSHNGGRGNR